MKYALLILIVIGFTLLPCHSTNAQEINISNAKAISVQEAAELLEIDDFFIEKAYRIGDIILIVYCNGDMHAENIQDNNKQRSARHDNSSNQNSDQDYNSSDDIDFSELDKKIEKAIASKDVNDFRAAADEAMLDYYWPNWLDNESFYSHTTTVESKIFVLLKAMIRIDNSFEILTDLIYLEAQKGVHNIYSDLECLVSYIKQHKDRKHGAIIFLNSLLNNPNVNINNTLYANEYYIRCFIEDLERI